MGPEASSQRQTYREGNRASRREQTMPPQSYDDRRDGRLYYTPAQVPTSAPVLIPAPVPISGPFPPSGLPPPPKTPPPNSLMMENRLMDNTIYITNPETVANAAGAFDQLTLPLPPQPVYPSYPVCNPPCQPVLSSTAASSKLSDPNAYGIDDPNYVDRYRVINGVRLALPRRKSELPTSAEVFRSFRYYIPGKLPLFLYS